MALLPKPHKPLRILTIDGGGLQGISTLLILDSLLDAVARHNRVPESKPRPCDVFDVIAGIGPGGWLALLLGRFQMDVSAALAEWYNLIDCIAPRSRAEEIRMRVLQHSYFDTDRLVEQIDELTEFYQTDKHMFFTPPEGTRCKHVFVSALKTDSKDRHLGYNLFRTYDCPKGADVLEGPSNPREYKISHAFGATGAAKYFTPPWREPTAKRGISRFLDVQFPSPHNITELALNEIWGLYGEDVEISLVVNIGPGIPNASDCRNIARKISWKTRSPALLPQTKSTPKDRSHDDESPDGMLHDASGINQRIKFDQNLPAPAGNVGRKTPVARQTTFGSERSVGIEKKLRRDEKEIESDIRRKLRNVYPNHTPPYYRLAPEISAPGTAQNDTFSPKASSVYTTKYLHIRRVEREMEEVGESIDLGIPVAAC